MKCANQLHTTPKACIRNISVLLSSFSKSKRRLAVQNVHFVRYFSAGRGSVNCQPLEPAYTPTFGRGVVSRVLEFVFPTHTPENDLREYLEGLDGAGEPRGTEWKGAFGER